MTRVTLSAADGSPIDDGAMRAAGHSGETVCHPACQTDAQIALLSAITEACRLRGDDDANRDALVAECLTLDAAMQADLTAHFNDVVRMYRAILTTNRKPTT